MLISLKFVLVFSFVEEDRLDILVNNAGVMIPPHTLSEDGFEIQFHVNHLGDCLFRLILA